MLEAGDLVLCSVERIENTTVFVKILAENREIDGSIVISEIAPGRIRNLRDYVVPKKKIVCKILRIFPNGNVELSLRRVSQKEQKEVLERERQEKGYTSIVRGIVKENAEKIIGKISEKEGVFSFFSEAKENPKKLAEFFSKQESEKILDVLNSQKQKKAVLKEEIFLKSERQNGITLIKEIFGALEGAEVRYLSAGKYSIKVESGDMKKASGKMKESLSKIEKKAKELNLEFSIK